MPKVEAIAANLSAAAEQARNSQEYLGYANHVDAILGDIQSFTKPEASEALGALADVLDQPENAPLVWHVGWDIPELLMCFLEHFESGVANQPDPDFLRATSRLGNVLCLKSNPKEFFLKVCELLAQTEDTFEDEDFDLDDEDAEYSANAKFCLLFEMMRFSLNRIKTNYPTRFIKTANSILLDVANSKTTVTGVTVVLRRIFIFARDFDMDLSEASEEERLASRRLLVSLLTYGADVSLQQFNVKWLERFHFQLANKVSTNNDPNVRSQSYQMSLYTERLEDALNRCGQLALSYDMDPIQAVVDLVLKDDTSSARSYARRPTDDQDATLDYLLQPSMAGMFLLYTQMYFHAPPCKYSLFNSIKKTVFIRRNLPLTAGMRDAVLYWALRAVSHVDPSSYAEIAADDLTQYISVIMDVAGASPLVNERCLAFCITSKILSRLNTESAVRIMLTAIRSSQYPQILDAAVQILKSLVLGKKPQQRSLASQLKNLDITTPEISQEVRRDIALTAEAAVDDIVAGKSTLSPYILSWINLLTVVGTDKPTVERLSTKLESYLDNYSACTNIELIKVALQNLHRPRQASVASNSSAAVAGCDAPCGKGF